MIKFFRQKKTGLVGLLIFLFLVTVAVIGPSLNLPNPYKVDPHNRLLPPSKKHLFGTDAFGRDILSRCIIGARTSLLVGASVALTAFFFGVPIGIMAAYFPWANMPLMRLIDALMAFPSIILALALMTILGRPSIINVIIAISIVYIPRTARLAYSSTLVIKELAFVEAARAIGSDTSRILVRHVFVNLVSPIIVQSTFTFAFSILEAAALDFLGVGIPPEVPSWGGTINENRVFILLAPWTIIFPGVFLAIAVLALNILGDNLRDFLDPRLRKLV